MLQLVIWLLASHTNRNLISPQFNRDSCLYKPDPASYFPLPLTDSSGNRYSLKRQVTTTEGVECIRAAAKRYLCFSQLQSMIISLVLHASSHRVMIHQPKSIRISTMRDTLYFGWPRCKPNLLYSRALFLPTNTGWREEHSLYSGPQWERCQAFPWHG